MNDIIIDGKNYDFICRETIDDKEYIVFEDEDGIYVSEYKIVDKELELIQIDIELQKKILEGLGIDYGI